MRNDSTHSQAPKWICRHTMVSLQKRQAMHSAQKAQILSPQVHRSTAAAEECVCGMKAARDCPMHSLGP